MRDQVWYKFYQNQTKGIEVIIKQNTYLIVRIIQGHNSNKPDPAVPVFLWNSIEDVQE